MVQGRLTVLKFESFRKFKNITHFITCKEGWVNGSKPRFTNSEDSDVLAFRRELAVSGEWKLGQFIFPNQTHSDIVGTVNSLSKSEDFDAVDALITNNSGLFICVQTADCVPILLFDPVKNVAAVVHAGWKGTVSKIAKKTVERMFEEFGCEPSGIVAGIGPSIHIHAYEVGREVVELVWKNFENSSAILKPSLNPGKAYFDLWEANKIVLLESGLTESNIEIMGLCTFGHPELFYSARRDGGDTGRMVSCIKIA